VDSSPAGYRAALDAACREVIRFRAAVDGLPVQPPSQRDALRAELSLYDFAQPRDLDALVGDVAGLMTDWNLHTPHPLYFGLFNPDVVPASVAADTLVAGMNPQMAAYSHAPAACEIESHVLRFFARRVWPVGDALGSFTSGGLEANLSATIVALTHVLPAFEEEGAVGRPTLYVTENAHHSFHKIAHACGLGRRAVRVVPVGADLMPCLVELRAMIAEDRRAGRTPVMVVATAGTTAAGVIEPIAEMAALCRSEGLWLHADAAWGGAALLSEKLAPLLAGIADADSVTIDAHKWMSVPMGGGMFLTRHPDACRRAFGIQTNYMPEPSESPDPYVTSLQWSRRFIGLKVFMALANLGVEGYAEQIERQAEMADLLAVALPERGWEVVFHSPLAVVCFRDASVPAGAIAAAVHRRRRAWVSETRLPHAGAVLRACVTNFRTRPEHIDALLDELEAARRECGGPS
jgi:glutamate/tyrosine decarboxylase-like PLP-dependent enzyme